MSTNKKLPIITVIGGKLSEIATDGEGALIAFEAPIYQRGLFLVYPALEEVSASKGRKAKVGRLLTMDENYLRDWMCQSANWQSRTSYGSIAINPPLYIVKTILSRKDIWRFKKVIGILTTPTLRPDGSILNKEGYDPDTQLLLQALPEMPIMPSSPSYKDALDALALLEDLLTEFPFVDEESKSVALSILMTPVVRGAMSVVPMHVVNASTPGTGKSYLLDLTSSIALGQLCPVMAAGRNEEETEKRLDAALIAGQQIISIDNVNGDLGGDKLCQAVERPVVNVRILGKSEQVKIESRSTILATGNNIRLVGDMNRRVIVCSLDANKERPELRQFNNDPVEKVMADRGKYIAAILNIIRAYINAGSPNKAPRLASFEEWSDLVRSALIWLGKEDPVKTMDKARREDPMLQTAAALFTAIKNTFGLDVKKTAREIIRATLISAGTEMSVVTEYDVAKSIEVAAAQDPSDNEPVAVLSAGQKIPVFTLVDPSLELIDALTEAIGYRPGDLNPRDLGKWFKRHKGRIIGNLRLDGGSDEHGHTAKWSVSEHK